jgi:CRP-like cAMP-binding protein
MAIDTHALARRNRVLAALPQTDLERLWARLELVSLDLRQTLAQSGEPIPFVYFPLTCVCSLVITVEGSGTVEVATVGSEGLVGLPVFLGRGSSPGTAICQVAGQALRLSSEALREETRAGGPLHDLLLRYSQGLVNQIAQSAACGRLHTIDQRCARWLLMVHDRVGDDRFPLTQQFLAQMLGVRRAGVSAAARVLARGGAIRYVRGVITVTDRAGLEAAACDCYRVVQDEFDRLLG